MEQSWTEVADLATARAGLGLSGTASTAAIAATGDIGTSVILMLLNLGMDLLGQKLQN